MVDMEAVCCDAHTVQKQKRKKIEWRNRILHFHLLDIVSKGTTLFEGPFRRSRLPGRDGSRGEATGSGRRGAGRPSDRGRGPRVEAGAEETGHPIPR